MRVAPITLVVLGARLWDRHPLVDADAIAIRGDRIAALGPSEAIASLAGPAARRIEAGGATVTPALTDAHLHLLPWAHALGQADLGGAASPDEALARLAPGPGASGAGLLVARGWDDARWSGPPTRAALDRVTGDRPTILHRHDFHAVWFNSAAMRAAGLADDTPDPEGGDHARDAFGRLAGLARERATQPFHVLEQAQLGTPPDAALDRAVAALWAQGITAVHDFHRDPDTFRTTSRLAARGRLRVLQQLGPEQLAGARALGVESGAGDAWFRVGALKLFADGTLGSRTAAMLAPFADRGGLGLEVMTAAELREGVAHAAAAGFATAIHAIGDRAVRHALDAFAATPDARALAIPARIEHVQLVDPSDLPRFAALGVVASLQPQHLSSDAATAREAWGRRCESAYAWAALRRSGATLVFGSDAPVESPAAGDGLAAAVFRRGLDGLPFHPEQAVGLDAALQAWITAPPAVSGDRGLRGTLAPGALADLVVWDRDLHAFPVESLPGLRARVTVLAGEIVHDGGQDPAPLVSLPDERSA